MTGKVVNDYSDILKEFKSLLTKHRLENEVKTEGDNREDAEKIGMFLLLLNFSRIETFDNVLIQIWIKLKALKKVA